LIAPQSRIAAGTAFLLKVYHLQSTQFEGIAEHKPSETD
jgi:hypothetical protein